MLVDSTCDTTRPTSSTRVALVLLVGALHLLTVAPRARAQGSSSASPPPEALRELGDFERQAVRRVLRNNNWSIARSPKGKTVGEVHVVTLPVFSERDPESLQWFNRLHATTEPEVIRREVLLEPGNPWESERAEETERILRNPVFTTLAVVLPLASDEGGKVDVLVVTRDIWSLRTNSNFEYQNGVLSKLFISASENNLLGRHKSVNATFEMDLGSFAMGPIYYDPAVFGTQAEFTSQADVIFSRNDGTFEGTRSETTLAYPIWNLDRTWGAELTVAHSDEVVREFRGTQLLPYDNPETPQRESVPYRYRSRSFGAEGRAIYARGEVVEHRYSLGYRFTTQSSELPPDFPSNSRLRDAFRRDVMPPDELNSGPLVGYYAFTPRWITYRNISTYDLPEEKRLGPYLNLQAVPILEELGSTESFLELYSALGYRLDIAHDGFVWFETSAKTRLRGERWFDNEFYAFVQAATPDVARVARLVTRVRSDLFLNDTQNRFEFAGGQNGLRGYGIGAFAGEARLLGNLELRSMPLEVAFLRAGGLLFWDVGHASEQLADLELRNDVGAGLRILVPQANTIPLRIDWAFPVRSDGLRWPGRLSIGFGQIF